MKSSRILVVDENAEIAQLEHAMFRLHNHNVEVTVHAEEALRRLATRRYDVLVIGAPILVRGRYFLDILKAEFPTMLPCSIVVTWKSRDEEVLLRCERCRVYAVLAKPFDVEELSRVVDECIANECQPVPTKWIGVPQALVPKNETAR